MGPAASFTVSTERPARAARALEAALGKVQHPKAALVFACGTLGEDAARLAQALLERVPRLPVLLGVGAGVLNEHSEIENQSAAAGLVWSGAPCSAAAFDVRSSEFVHSFKRHMQQTDARTAFLLARPDHFEPEVLSGLSLEGRTLFGGGTVSAADVYLLDGHGHVSHGSLGALCCAGAMPQLGITRASRLITPLRPITKLNDNLLLEIDGEPALDVLSSAGQELEGQPLIFVALSSEQALESATPHRPPALLLRPIQGVDPARRGILLSEDAAASTHAAFAIRDPSSARQDLESMAREMVRECAGAAPRFAVYVNCAGRGSGLYAAPNVDIRLLRARLGDIPMVGFQSAFELAPQDGCLGLHLYTGVLALFTSPS